MAKILILYYSMHGHTRKMAEAVAEGAMEGCGKPADLRRVPETMSDTRFQEAGGICQSEVAEARVDELASYDAILFGTPTRYGNMCGQMRTFLDQTGSLWKRGDLIGKVASVFTSTATQHGGSESTLLTFHPTLLHLGMIIVGLPYSCNEQMGLDRIKGGSPYGAANISGVDGDQQPNEAERSMARFQGRHVAQIATRLRRGGGAD
ncbi:MAG: NAD(P)H:quinone oxidoreductase [Polycyclovorans sp.]|jgi:NAD(P)H dehydrogenase (quinone)|nr:NAD(P)H:quinone oxidoreductase [Gammaproteobacteria bacterium]MDP1542793.1 NAD(P)H:quinone oxidoreductase [Polycyclovorans sp.]